MNTLGVFYLCLSEEDYSYFMEEEAFDGNWDGFDGVVAAFGNLTVGLGSWWKDPDKSAGHMSKLVMKIGSLAIVAD